MICGVLADARDLDFERPLNTAAVLLACTPLFSFSYTLYHMAWTRYPSNVDPGEVSKLLLTNAASFRCNRLYGVRKFE
jgi:hypothetical protein